ncbi:MAG: protein-glutamate O-methyltransferase CheR [Limnohabitans sp.]|jgi:chemotaxis protein methyltransferase CheR|nr:protein-glutamate O-methyltransferase CheR [Limnohabitans sp.]
MSVLTESTFKRIADIARRRWGLSLGERKMQLVANRLTSHLRKSGGGAIEDYVGRLERNPTEDDMLVLFDILSTNVTSFFRDPAHFAFLERELYTGLAKGTLALPGKRLRIWSAACSIGAEPYSLAMQALELLPANAGYDVKILATDLANKAIVGCREGVYTEAQLTGLSPERRAKFLVKADPKPGTGEPRWRVKDEVKRLVEVRRQNLVEPYTGLGPFDVIFLRNVMIYFDRDTRREVVMRMHGVMRPGSIIAVGSAETLSGLDVPLKAAAPSIYLR